MCQEKAFSSILFQSSITFIHTVFSSSFPFVPYFEFAVRNLRRAVGKGPLHFWVETKVQDAKLLQCTFMERMVMPKIDGIQSELESLESEGCECDYIC